MRRESIEEYADWMVDFIQNEKQDIGAVPEWYKPIMAYMQLVSINDGLTLAPWDIPKEWVDSLAAMWMGNRLARVKVLASENSMHGSINKLADAISTATKETKHRGRGRSSDGGVA